MRANNNCITSDVYLFYRPFSWTIFLVVVSNKVIRWLKAVFLLAFEILVVDAHR